MPGFPTPTNIVGVNASRGARRGVWPEIRVWLGAAPTALGVLFCYVSQPLRAGLTSGAPTALTQGRRERHAATSNQDAGLKPGATNANSRNSRAHSQEWLCHKNPRRARSIVPLRR